MLFNLFLFALAVLVLIWAVARFHLKGPNLSAFDHDTGERFSQGPEPGAEILAVVDRLGGLGGVLKGVPRRQHNAVLRKYMDDMFAERSFDTRITPAGAGGARAEWVVALGADTTRRTLYIHGGAFVLGSPLSHRTLTSRFAEITGGAVLAIDYRLMPEHPRLAGIEDCRLAYRWLLENGPDGLQPANTVFVAGDSAGGNLTLSLLNWVRDTGLRAPDAAVALSPATDSTLGSPSLFANVSTDAMLGPLFGRLSRVPLTILLWAGWLQTRIRPCDPLVSPLHAELSKLPPVLVQASSTEMLYDDARRYVNKAQKAGSPVKLQSWDHMVHVWQIFNPELPEANQALDEIGKFLAEAAPRRDRVAVD